MRTVKRVTDLEQHRIGFAIALLLKQELVEEYGRFETSLGLLLPEGIWTEVMEILEVDHKLGESLAHSGKRIAGMFEVQRASDGGIVSLIGKLSDLRLAEVALKLCNDEVYLLSVIDKVSGDIEQIDSMYEVY